MINITKIHAEIVEQDDRLRRTCLAASSGATTAEAALLDCQLAIHERLGNIMELLMQKP